MLLVSGAAASITLFLSSSPFSASHSHFLVVGVLRQQILVLKEIEGKIEYQKDIIEIILYKLDFIHHVSADSSLTKEV